VIKKTADENTLCYFCYQPLEPKAVGSRRTSEHHVNFPKCNYKRFDAVRVWCHHSCQQRFHREYDEHCRWTPDDELKCDTCDPVSAMLCLYNKHRFSEIDEDELSLILRERKWLAEEVERAKEAKKRDKIFFPKQAFAAE